MAAATTEALQQLRTDAKKAHQTVVARIDALDSLVARIDAGLKRADDNFKNLELRATQSEGLLKDANDTFRAMNVQNIQLEVAQMLQATSKIKNDSDAYKAHVETVHKEAGRKFEQHQGWSRNNVTRLQQMIAQAPSSSGTNARPQSGQKLPLDQNRTFEKLSQLMGHEPLGRILEWYARFQVKINSVLPGSEDVLKEVLRQQEPLQFDDIQLLEQPGVANKLNAELYALLSTLHTDKAWSSLKSIRSTDGLEAYRWVYKNITKQTPQQLLNEHRYLNGPHGPKTINEISGWIYAWEDRMRVLRDINPQYAIGGATRRNVAYAAMPQQIKSSLANKFAKGNLLDWPALRTFLITFSDADSSNKETSNPPISLAPVTQHAPQHPSPTQPKAEYTPDEWIT